MKAPLSILSIAMLAAAIATPNAHAGTSARMSQESGSRACQGALPAFAGTLRARPLGIGNEGAAPAFVTCAWEGWDGGYGRTMSQASLYMGNTGAEAVTVNCTFVHGHAMGSNNTYAPVSHTLNPGDGTFVHFPTSQMGLDQLYWPQVSCALPRGAVIHYLYQYYNEEIGS
ncbi:MULTISPECIES: hypothetical protein [unclassified Luteimonas]